MTKGVAPPHPSPTGGEVKTGPRGTAGSAPATRTWREGSTTSAPSCGTRWWGALSGSSLRDLRLRVQVALTPRGLGFRIVSGGTDNHLLLLDVTKAGLTGKVAEKVLEEAGMTVNKNTIPFDPNPPLVASGVRIGVAAVTTRGMKEPEMDQIGDLIAEALRAPEDGAALAGARAKVRELCGRFPLYDALM